MQSSSQYTIWIVVKNSPGQQAAGHLIQTGHLPRECTIMCPQECISPDICSIPVKSHINNGHRINRKKKFIKISQEMLFVGTVVLALP